MSEKKERFLNGAIAIFVALSIVLMVHDTAVSGQQSTLSTTAKATSTTAIPGEWVNVVFETTGNQGDLSFLPYWHPKGVTLFGARAIELDAKTVHLGTFYVDSTLAPGDHNVEFLVVDEAGQGVQIAVAIKVGPGFPRDLDKIADKLSPDVAITHANHPDGRFQAIAHFKSAKSLKAIANLYRAWLNANGWEESLEVSDPNQRFGTVSDFHGFLQAKKDGQQFQLQLDVDAITVENKVKVTFDFR